MRITSLTLTNFRSYLGISIPTDARRVLFAGLNGSGKSTIRESVKWLLTGKCDVTDGKGSGVEWLQPEGTTTVQVAAMTDTIGQIVRHSKNGTKELLVDGSVGDLTAVQLALWSRLRTSQAYIDAVCDTDYFLRLHHADAKALILELLDVRVEVDGKPYTLEQLDAAYQKAFDNRRMAKVRLKAHTVPPPPAAEPFPTISAIDQQLTTLRTALGERQRALGVAQGARAALERRLLDSRVRAVVEDVDALETAIQDVEAVIQRMMTESLAEVVPETERERLEQLVDVLSAHKPPKGCVLDPHVECRTHKNTFVKQIKVYREQLAVLPAAAPPPVPSRGLVDLQHDRDRLVMRRDQSLRARADNEARAKQEQAIRAELETLGPAMVDPEIETLQARIQKGEMLRQRAQAHWDAATRYDQAVKQKAELQADVDGLETLCERLGPNGLRVQALGEAIGRFTTSINAFIEPFGWTVAFEFEPWKVTVNGRPLNTYSESEQYRIGIAVQLAIANLSGLSFAIVDRMDMLDVKNRNLAARMIFAAPVDQVFMLSTSESDKGLPKAEGLLAYRLELQNGRTQIVEGLNGN